MRIVKHPFIVNLNWAFQTQAHLMLVMDYCPGGDLSKLLDQKLTLPEKLVKHYVAEITLALECLH
jgi:serine/threonine protein kinase